MLATTTRRAVPGRPELVGARPPRRPTGSRGRAAGRTARGTRRTPRGTRPGSRSRSRAALGAPGAPRTRRRSSLACRRAASRASNRASSASTRRSSAGRGQPPAVPPGAAAPPAAIAPTPSAPADEHAERQEPREQVEARLRRLGEHSRAELGDERVLDLLLGVAGRDAHADDTPSSARAIGAFDWSSVVSQTGQTSSASRSAAFGAAAAAVTPTPAASARSVATQRQPRHGASPRASAIPRSNVARLRSMSTGAGDPLDHELPGAVDEERLGEPAHPALRRRSTPCRRRRREGEPVAAHEPPRVLPEVLRRRGRARRAPGHGCARQICSQDGCLLRARDAPGRPEVEHDRLPAQVGESRAARPGRGARA